MPFLGHFSNENLVFSSEKGYLDLNLLMFGPAPRKIIVGLGQKSSETPRVKRRSALHGRIWVLLEPSWKQIGPTCGQPGACLSQLWINLVEIGAILGQFGATLGTENMKIH